MKNSEALDLMMARLGGRSAATLRAKVLSELNEKIRQLESGPDIPWFMEERLTGTLTQFATQNYIELSSDFIREVEEGRFKMRHPSLGWKALVKVTLETLEDETENVDPAFPEGYALFGNKIYLGPAPAAAYQYKLPYFKRTTAVVDNGVDISNSWLIEFFNYTTLSALMVVATLHVQSAEIAAKIQPELQAAADYFFRALEARRHVNMDYLLDNSEN